MPTIFCVQDAFSNHHNVLTMASRLFALFVWAAVAASLAFWGLRWIARPAGVPSNASSVSLDGGAHGDARRLLTGPAPANGAPVVDQGVASVLASRLKLIGVVAPRTGTDQGVALMSIDGKPPRAIRVGGIVDGEMTLLSLTQRGAQIGPSQGPTVVSLDLPPLPPPNTGLLPPPTGVTTGSPPVAPGYGQPMVTGAGGPGGMGGGMSAPRPMAPAQPGASGPLSSPEAG